MASISQLKLPDNTVYNIKGSIHTVIGTQTSATGSWTGDLTSIEALYDGLTIAYYLPYAGSGNASLNLTLKNNTTTGAINCYIDNGTRLSTQYKAGSIIPLTYFSANSISIDGVSITEACWIAQISYEMVILSYGLSTWNDFIRAYKTNSIVYCRASSNSNPASGSKNRLAFMAYVNNEENPTEVEFQYYRSVATHSDSQQGDQVYIYKLKQTSGWESSVREAYTKVVAGTGLSSSYSSGKITLNASAVAASAAPEDIDITGAVGTSTNYARQDHTHKISLTTGDANGQVKIAGTNVDVKGLGSNAYTSTAYAPLASPALTGTPTAPTATSGTNSTQIATTAYVDNAINGLPTPMQFIGTVGTNGTVTWANLAVAAAANTGYTYKVITDHTAETGKPAAKTGDTIVSNGSEWIVIPSGDEPSGTVTSITLKAGTGISLDTDNTAITSSGTRTISHADTSSQASSSNSGRTYIQSVTLDDYGHVTGLSTATESVTNTDTKLQVAAITSGTTYYPIVGTGTTAATRQYDTTGLVYVGTNGTANGTNGNSLLTLGNSTASTTANWKKGTVRLYGTTAYYTDVVSGAPTANRTITLPNATGTLALTTDIPTVPTNVSSFTNDAGYSTLTLGSTASTAAAGNHSHGNITNGGDITATAPTIANGDQIIINDNSASKITNGPTFDGSTTTTALTPKGTWETFSKFSGSYNDLSDKPTIPTDTNTTYALSNTLSSHKFTETLTAGGSGSGTSTATMEFVAGTGITLTDDTTNKKITIACSVTDTDTKVKLTSKSDSVAYKVALGPSSITSGTAYEEYYSTNLTYNPSTKALLTGGSVDGYTLAAASAKAVDTSISAGSSSANLPTSAAVATFVEGKSYITDAGVTKITTTAGTHTAITNSTGAVSFNVPTKTSHLTNDSGFVTSDTKNTAGSTDSSSKLFLIGATSQTANPQTYSDNETYVTNGTLRSTKYNIADHVIMQYNSTTAALDFIFN